MERSRRSFLKMMFGGLAAAVAGPVVARELTGIDIVMPSENPIVQPWCFVQNFSLEDELSVLMRLPKADFFMHQIGIYFNPECSYDSLRRAIDGLWFEMAVGKNIYMESPVAYMASASGLLASQGPSIGNRFHCPLVVSDDLNIKLLSAAGGLDGVAGVKGQIIVQGLMRRG